MSGSAFKKTSLTSVLLVLWGLAVIGGMGAMLRYQMTPAEASELIPAQWPAGMAFSHSLTRPTLVMTLHPQCPCSRASLHELSELLARADGKLDVHVLFIKPSEAPASWIEGALWRQAAEIPGVTVSIDQNAINAKALGATASGQVFLFSPSGTLLFHGGITDGRGHEGDNDGLSALLEIIRGRTPKCAATPVYGCALGTHDASLKKEEK